MRRNIVLGALLSVLFGGLALPGTGFAGPLQPNATYTGGVAFSADAVRGDIGTITCPAGGPCTLTISVNVADVGNPINSSLLESVGTYSLAASLQEAAENNVTAQSVQAITFGVDDLTTVQLDIDVRTPQVQTGWTVSKTQAICGNAAQACRLTFTGPAGLEDGLHAFVVVVGTVSFNTYDQLSSTVQFDQNGRVFDPAAQKALPLVGWNPQTVTAHVEAQQGTSIIRVPLVDMFLYSSRSCQIGTTEL